MASITFETSTQRIARQRAESMLIFFRRKAWKRAFKGMAVPSIDNSQFA